jgi:hypothetical protein
MRIEIDAKSNFREFSARFDDSLSAMLERLICGSEEETPGLKGALKSASRNKERASAAEAALRAKYFRHG